MAGWVYLTCSYPTSHRSSVSLHRVLRTPPLPNAQLLKQYNTVSGWAVALVVVLVVLMAYSVLRISKVTLSAYLGGKDASGAGADNASLPTVAPSKGGGGDAGKGEAGGKGTTGVWTAAEGMLTRMRGGGAGASGARGGTAAKEVEAARDRERLLRSEP
jgi:hypothetical protein